MKEKIYLKTLKFVIWFQKDCQKREVKVDHRHRLLLGKGLIIKKYKENIKIQWLV